MNSLEKEFVPYELALRMKQLGFDEKCYGAYSIFQHNKWKLHLDFLGVKNQWFKSTVACTAPTFSQSFDWFEDTFQLYPSIVVDQTSYPKYAYEIARFFGNPKKLADKEWGWNEMILSPNLYRTKMEAKISCLKMLLEIVDM